MQHAERTQSTIIMRRKVIADQKTQSALQLKQMLDRVCRRDIRDGERARGFGGPRRVRGKSDQVSVLHHCVLRVVLDNGCWDK